MVPGPVSPSNPKPRRKATRPRNFGVYFQQSLDNTALPETWAIMGSSDEFFGSDVEKTALKFDVFSQRTRQWVQKNGQVDERSIFRHTLWRDELICFQRFQPQIRGV